MTIWWEFADKDDLDTAITVSAPTWYYAREFARSLFGDNCIETTTKEGARITGEGNAKYQLRWSGNACTSASNLKMQIRKLDKRGRYTGWRFL